MPASIVSDDILMSIIDQYIRELTLGILLHYNRSDYTLFPYFVNMLCSTELNKPTILKKLRTEVTYYLFENKLLAVELYFPAVFNKHLMFRARVLGYLNELEECPDGGEHAIIDKEGCDIFGQPKEVTRPIALFQLAFKLLFYKLREKLQSIKKVGFIANHALTCRSNRYSN